MQYHCLVYFDPRQAFDGSPQSNALLDEVGPTIDRLTRSGHLLMFQPLNLPQEAITVHVRDGKVSTADGPFMETKEMLGGLMLIEARDLNEALQIAAGIPHARLGHVEVRPAIDFGKPRPVL